MKAVKDKYYSFEHTRERALERYGILLTHEGYNELEALCTDKNTLFIEVAADEPQTIHEVFWHNRYLIVVKRQWITTLLPPRSIMMSVPSDISE